VLCEIVYARVLLASNDSLVVSEQLCTAIPCWDSYEVSVFKF
jgi:hypothetical protein